MNFNAAPGSQQNNQEKKLDYLALLKSIENNHGRLEEIARRFLERPDLITGVKAKTDPNFRAYGVNSLGETTGEDADKIIGQKTQGITINPNHLTEEVAVHELVHFFSMPALKLAYEMQQKGMLDQAPEEMKKYALNIQRAFDYASSKGYRSTNSHSMTHDIEEFAVNFTNEQSAEQLKQLGIYQGLVDSFFRYYNSIKTPDPSASV